MIFDIMVLENRGVFMDFKIGDEIEENVEEEENGYRGMPKWFPIAVIVACALFFGLTVFFISNALFGKKVVEPEPMKSIQLDLNDENVQILYGYVTYGTKNERNDKFVTNSTVTLDTFNNTEKFYYALQFAQVEDFAATGRVDEKNRKIYHIASAKMKTYMQRYFGPNVSYQNNVTMSYPFTFRINGQNVGLLSYSNIEDGFDTVFDGLEEDVNPTEVVLPYYGQLVSAEKKPDGSHELVEKVIYTTSEKVGESYQVSIYGDPAKTKLLDTKSVTVESLIMSPISVSDYLDDATEITYLFGLNGNTLYFTSSQMTKQ